MQAQFCTKRWKWVNSVLSELLSCQVKNSTSFVPKAVAPPVVRFFMGSVVFER